MSRIKGRNTKPELIVAALLKDLKIPFETHNKSLSGTPDFYLPDYNLIIDVHGCFWHSHQSCRYFVLPHQNRDFWITKLGKNVERDKAIKRLRRKEKISTLIIWECDVKSGKYFEKILRRL